MSTEALQSYHLIPSQNKAIREWKEQGKKVLGVMTRTAPEELIYAAGIFPVHLLGTPQPIKEATSYFSPWTCHISRSVLDLGLLGEYQVLDGMVIPHMCDAMYGLAGALEEFLKLPYFYWLPHPHSAKAVGALEFMVKELEVLKKSLEEFTGTEITTQSLKKAIEVYNYNRALLKEAYDLRGLGEQPLISGVEYTQMVFASLLLPKEESNHIIKAQIERAKQRHKPLSLTGPRILVYGSILQDSELFELIESRGAMVIADDIDTGSRYFWDSVDASLEPLLAIAKHRLLGNIPDACFASDGAAKERLDYLRNMIKQYRVDGVIFALQVWCDTHEFDHPYFVEQLQQAGIPTLTIAVEGPSGTAQINTRVEAFLETFLKL